MRWFITAFFCIGLLALVGCGGGSGNASLDSISGGGDCKVMNVQANINSEDDLAAMQDYCEVADNVVVSDSTIQSLSLPKLKKVTGSIEVRNNAGLQQIHLPALETVGDAVTIEDNEALTTIECAKLKTVDLGLNVSGNLLLEGIAFPALATSHGVRVAANGELTSFEFPVLESIGGSLQVGATTADNDKLLSFAFPVLESVDGQVLLWKLHQVETIEFPALQVVGGYFEMDQSTGVASLSSPVLTSIGSHLRVNQNKALATLNFPALASVETNFQAWGNPSLAQCLIDALLDQITVGGTVNVLLNNDECTCAEVNGVMEATCT